MENTLNLFCQGAVGFIGGSLSRLHARNVGVSLQQGGCLFNQSLELKA